MIKEIENNNQAANELLKLFNCSVDKIMSSPFNHILMYDDKGIIVYSKIYDRIEVEYINIVDKYKRLGIGTKLINYVIDNNQDINNITLEVRENNKIAIQFYQKLGFMIVAKREKYYGNEDAILMIRKFDNNEK